MRNKVQLIAYANRFGGSLRGLARLLRDEFAGIYEGVHILPFFTPFDGRDAGFDPINHLKVDRRLGTWDDIRDIATDHEVMSDVMVNEMSDQSRQFKGVLRFGERSKYYPMFLTFASIFPHGASEQDLMRIHTPSAGMPFTVYEFAGRPRLVWTTAGNSSADINVNSRQGWDYLMSILDTEAKAGIRCVSLVSSAYAVKKPGGTDFLMPETLDFTHRLTQAAHERGLETVLDTHAYYKERNAFADAVDYLYDYALEPLLLWALLFGDAEPLARWLRVRPKNCLTVIDMHDGIGVEDVSAAAGGSSLAAEFSKKARERATGTGASAVHAGKGMTPSASFVPSVTAVPSAPSSPSPDADAGDRSGFLTDGQIEELISAIARNTHGESVEATGSSAINVDLRQVNSTFYSAIGCDDQKYLAARALQFFLPGIPQVYYMGAMMKANDVELFRNTRVGRDLNRHYFTASEIRLAVMRPEVKALNALCRFRNQLEAFDGTVEIGYDDTYGVMSLVWTGKTTRARLDFDAPLIAERQTLGVSDPDVRWRSIATITWTDAAGEHKTNDLLNHPPVAHQA